MNEKLIEPIEMLKDSKSKKRESAAKKLRKIADAEAGSFLLDALQNEILDSRTWSTQYHLILAIGFCGYTKALPFLSEMTRREFNSTILYSGLGDSIFRLLIIDKSVDESLDFIFDYEDFRIYYGAFRAMAMLKLIPDDQRIKRIIEIGSDEKGIELLESYPGDKTGMRKWIASASAGWKNDLKLDFLNECEKIKDQHLEMAVVNSRKGKYVDWKPY